MPKNNTLTADLVNVFNKKGVAPDDLNECYITNGYEAGVYSIEGKSAFGEGLEWGCLILIPVYDTQLAITTRTACVRNRTGSPLKWNSWKTLV